MTPDRLRGWLKRRPAGAQRVQLVADGTAGTVIVADWEREELDAMSDDPQEDIAATMLTQAQEYTDGEGEAQKFLVRWLGSKERVLKVVRHHVAPTPGEDSDAEASSNGITDASIIKDLLRAHLDDRKVTNSSLATVTTGYEKTIEMLTVQLENAYKLIADLRAQEAAPSHTATVVEQTVEQREESIQRSEALKVLTGKLPEILDLSVAAIATRFLPQAGKDLKQ